MLKNEDILKNNIDILDKKTIINTKYKIPKFPIYMGCVENNDYNNDKLLDLEFGISDNTGIIQICKYPTDECIYMFGSHNNAYGKMWNDLFNKLIGKIMKYTSNVTNIYEIGGGNGKLFKLANDSLIFKKYYIYEPNTELLNVDNDKLEIIKKYFTREDVIDDADVIVHSHVLEHISDPYEFMKSISKNMSEKTYHVFAIPNLYLQFKKKYTNCLMFEHKNFITERIVDFMINDNNMEIIEKDYLHEHSIIYVVKKNNNVLKTILPNLYDEYNLILDEFFNYHKNNILEINNKIKECIDNNKQIYVFGAHIFTQFLVSYGLNTEKIEYILDNDDNKINKRLYGTNLYVVKPDYIVDKNCAVILNVASYKDEIKNQLLGLNKDVYII